MPSVAPGVSRGGCRLGRGRAVEVTRLRVSSRVAARSPSGCPLAHTDRRVRVLAIPLLVVGAATAALVGIGFLLDAPTPPPPRSDAIVVISGDEQMARFREGVRLYHAGFGRYLVFSGAARDAGPSNADVMSGLAVEQGVPAEAILEESQGEDTWGNAVYTRRLLEQHGLSSAILVTSPYHVRRALLTFRAAYEGSGIRLAARSAPDSEWRKQSWWQQAETRRLTVSEVEKLAFIALTGRYRQ